MKREKLESFAKLLEKEQKERLHRLNIACEPNLKERETSIKYGKKYTKIDIGTSGRYMVDMEGNIYGIKAYGVIHKGHHYGTLDTINEYYWGDYTAYKKKVRK